MDVLTGIGDCPRDNPYERFPYPSTVTVLPNRRTVAIAPGKAFAAETVSRQQPGLPGGPHTERVGNNQPNKKRARRKFLHFFPDGFRDETYLDWERGYKWSAHQRWMELLNPKQFRKLMNEEKYSEIAATAVRIESRTNLLFSFEKMALRDAVKSKKGARLFATGLYQFLHGKGALEARFDRWCKTIESLPRKQTRVLTWPLVTIFGFIAEPETHIFLKPNVSRRAALQYGFDFKYESRPSWKTYASFLEFAMTVREDLRDLNPRDMIDLQSFIWVQGSDEYDEP